MKRLILTMTVALFVFGAAALGYRAGQERANYEAARYCERVTLVASELVRDNPEEGEKFLSSAHKTSLQAIAMHEGSFWKFLLPVSSGKHAGTP
jgi:hypothetical protein